MTSKVCHLEVMLKNRLGFFQNVHIYIASPSLMGEIPLFTTNSTHYLSQYSIYKW